MAVADCCDYGIGIPRVPDMGACVCSRSGGCRSACVGLADAASTFVDLKNPAGCNTGGYEDTSDLDERLWAAAELYVTTGNAAYLDKLEDYLKTNENPTDMGWWMCPIWRDFPVCLGKEKKKQRKHSVFRYASRNSGRHFLNEADKICDIADVSGYFVALTKEEYGWGSNMVVLNRAMIPAVAHLLTGEARYQKKMAQAQMDYILGVRCNRL